MIVALFQWLAARLGRRPTKPLDTSQQQQQQPVRGPGHDLDDFFTRLQGGPGYAPIQEMTEEEGELQYGTSHIRMDEYETGWPGDPEKK